MDTWSCSLGTAGPSHGKDVCLYKSYLFFPINSLPRGDTYAWLFSMMAICQATRTSRMVSDLCPLSSTGGSLAAPEDNDNWAGRGTGGGQRWPLVGWW